MKFLWKTSTSTPTIRSKQVQKYPQNCKRSREITQSLIKMIPTDIYPFFIVNNVRFINFVKIHMYLMLTRFTELRLVLPAVLAEICNRNIEQLTFKEWQIIQDAIKILKLFHEAANELSGEKYVTISKVILIVHCITAIKKKKQENNVTPQVTTFISNLLNELNYRFKDIDKESIYAISTMLDLRYKDIAFTSKEAVKLAKNYSINEYNSHISNMQSSTSSTTH
ncbi:Zinc finger BED domain-containing protein 1 [Habropoda laboriosa]|uniref:Zinc finger BED domain-containing protein 1 n=1 Tax=Habropoda laboriosa TaxID=597456 RepID=A0A0L7RH26_9HYME|nr:Zinc finger BED domain-containing protein 1 [Habropoda laboriosa]